MIVCSRPGCDTTAGCKCHTITTGYLHNRNFTTLRVGTSMLSFDDFLDTDEGLKLMAKAFEEIMLHGEVTTETNAKIREAIIRFVKRRNRPNKKDN